MFLTEKLTAENFRGKYPECFVEYRPIMFDGFVTGIECVGENIKHGVLEEIEKKVDIQRAKAEDCKGAKEICAWLNGVR